MKSRKYPLRSPLNSELIPTIAIPQVACTTFNHIHLCVYIKIIRINMQQYVVVPVWRRWFIVAELKNGSHSSWIEAQGGNRRRRWCTDISAWGWWRWCCSSRFPYCYCRCSCRPFRRRLWRFSSSPSQSWRCSCFSPSRRRSCPMSLSDHPYVRIADRVHLIHNYF